MMKFSKSLLTVLGLIVLIGFIGVLIYDVIMINQLHAVAGSQRSVEYQNPRNWVLIAAGLGLAAGFLLGAALAMPSRSFKARYEELRQREAAAVPPQTDERPGRAAHDTHQTDAPLEIDPAQTNPADPQP